MEDDTSGANAAEFLVADRAVDAVAFGAAADGGGGGAGHGPGGEPVALGFYWRRAAPTLVAAGGRGLGQYHLFAAPALGRFAGDLGCG